MITALLWYAVVTGVLAAVLLVLMTVQAVLPRLLRRHLPQAHGSRAGRAADPYPAEQQTSRALESAA